MQFPEQNKKGYILWFVKVLFTLKGYYANYADFGRGRVNFLHCSQYGAMIWICAENNVNNIKMFSVLLSSAYTEQSRFLLSYHQGGGWECTSIWEGTQL